MKLRNTPPIAAKPRLSRPCVAPPPPPPTRDVAAAHDTHTLDASVISDGYGSMLSSSSSVDDEYEDTAPIDRPLAIVEDDIDALFMHPRNVYGTKKNVTEINVNGNNTAQVRAQFYDIDNDDELCKRPGTEKVGACVTDCVPIVCTATGRH